MGTQLLLTNFDLLEPSFGEIRGGYELLIEGDVIRELSERPIRSAGATRIDCLGKTLLPGLIDSHVHSIHSEVNIRFMEALPLTLLTARAATRLTAMLNRGFTTVRDTGGADWGIKEALSQGHIVGPRLFIAGQSIGPTGGHSDSRRRSSSGGECFCCNGLQFKSAVADGVDEVRKAAREQMRQGADHVKIMMSGGVASPYDPLDSLQFSDGEVMAAVEESKAFGRYVCAHAYSAEAITRAAKLGVRTIEHGNLIDDASARLMAENGMYLVANLVAYYAMRERAAKWGMTAESLEKNEAVLQGGLRSLEICKRNGVPVAFGSDLLGELHWDQSREFEIRQEVVAPIDIIRSATLVGAEIVRMPGRIGTLLPGAFADLILVDGNPLANIALLAGQGERLSLIMKGGTVHKNRLNA
ncbi:MAG TPA: amidohydrolase family protein [Beijerinckiaceae bacterium]|mgnify:CR=1 FL=1|nr:amidohydrolase family protein [Beijerinckiaceae bacterium]